VFIRCNSSASIVLLFAVMVCIVMFSTIYICMFAMKCAISAAFSMLLVFVLIVQFDTDKILL